LAGQRGLPGVWEVDTLIQSTLSVRLCPRPFPAILFNSSKVSRSVATWQTASVIHHSEFYAYILKYYQTSPIHFLFIERLIWDKRSSVEENLDQSCSASSWQQVSHVPSSHPPRVPTMASTSLQPKYHVPPTIFTQVLNIADS
jgi:hypothetical protein